MAFPVSDEATDQLAQWPARARELFDELLDDAGSDLQREFIQRAVAAAHTPAEVHAFADELRAMSDEEAYEACTLDESAPRDYTVTQLLRAEADPLFAFELMGGTIEPNEDQSSPGFAPPRGPLPTLELEVIAPSDAVAAAVAKRKSSDSFEAESQEARPRKLDWNDLDTEMITSFLDHLETERHNTARTRNLRLTAIRSLFAYASLRHPEHAGLMQRVLAIPPKRFDKPTVSFLTASEIDALIDAPDRSRWEGRRDRAMLLLSIQTGLRVSELTGLDCSDVSLGTGASVRCLGKGRKHRAVPMTAPTEAVLAVWFHERAGRPDEPLFPTRTGRRLSSDAIERLVRKHALSAASRCPTLRAEKMHPHVLRHSCAMTLLQAGVDTAVIALWLGHEQPVTTHGYVEADLKMKEKCLNTLEKLPAKKRPSADGTCLRTACHAFARASPRTMQSRRGTAISNSIILGAPASGSKTKVPACQERMS